MKIFPKLVGNLSILFVGQLLGICGCSKPVTTHMTTFTDPGAGLYERILVKSNLPKLSHRSAVESIFEEKLRGEAQILRAVDRARVQPDAVLHIEQTNYHEETVFVPAKMNSYGYLTGSIYGLRGSHSSSYVGQHTVKLPTVTHHLVLTDSSGVKAWVADAHSQGYVTMTALVDDVAKRTRREIRHLLAEPPDQELLTSNEFSPEETVEETGESSPWDQLQIGLSQSEVLRILGDPASRSFGSRSQIWTYPEGRSVRFDRGRVRAWSKGSTGSSDDGERKYGFP